MSRFHHFSPGYSGYRLKKNRKKLKKLPLLRSIKHLLLSTAIVLPFAGCWTIVLANPTPTVPPASAPAPIEPVLVPSPQPGVTPPQPTSVQNFPGNIIELPNLQNLDSFLPAAEEEVRLVIRLKKRRVYVYRGEELDVSYPIAVGKNGWETPKGDFKVIEKKKDPAWQNPFTGEVIPPGIDNPLGARWIGFWTNGKNSIGFHGTPNEGSVGRAASHGCIRMFNKDVQKLFELVQVGTPVNVMD
jgi:L,D-transpeptidase ErfK/SrfK